ncbi:hypothetical protein AB0M39_41265 [Streptomyces sp. NPDC051907]|uniref:hypothetical protein n=1 Tax=Streptomyces sp. NPDC051907 TaxID=3155284 RepID=UPI0034318F33
MGGLAWALVNGEKDKGGRDGGTAPVGGASSDVSPGRTGDKGAAEAGGSGGTAANGGGSNGGNGNAGNGNDGDDNGGKGKGGNGNGGAATDGGSHGGATPSPQQYVKVYAQAVRGSYTGACPPPQAEAPAFRATITVGRTPVAVDYRWATESGRGSGDWQTLEFASGDGRQKRVGLIQLTHQPGQRYHDRIRMEIRSPVAVSSNWVDFSVDCKEEEPPSDESSHQEGDPVALRRAR